MRLAPEEEDSFGGERKRTRPGVSSLDYKTEYGHKLTTPRRRQPTRPPTQQLLALEQQMMMEHQQQQQQQQYYPHRMGISMKPTRAQGSNAIPPKKFEMLDSLEGMSKEELEMAFAQDPELAAAAEMVGEAAFTSKNKRSPYYRGKDGKLYANQHPEHLRAMMEEGIPVKQWIMLLFLLGAGLYQLRKVLLGPAAEKNGKTKASSSPRKSPKKAGSPKKVGKLKGKKGGGAKNESARFVSRSNEKAAKEKGTPVKSEPLPTRSIPTLVPADEKTAPAETKEAAASADENKAPSTQPADANNTKPAKKKKKPAKKTQKQAGKEGTLTTDEKKQSQSLGVVASLNGISADGTGGQSEQVDEGDGWHTVGKGNVADDKDQSKNGHRVSDSAKQNEENEAPPKLAEAKMSDTSPELEKEPDTSQEPKKALATPASNDAPVAASKAAPKKNGKSESNKATKVETASAPVASPPVVSQQPVVPPPPGFSTDDDAALAAKLQEEEEKLAKAFSEPTAEDSWAEVAPKKSRRKTNEHVPGPAATAAW